MQLVSAAFIVTVQKYDFRSHFVLRPGVQVFHPCEADKMLLKTLASFGCGPSALRREQATSRDRASLQG